ncbi:hypothetical protein VSR01_10840 [Actinacidiphila sp. DG2A-62]|uniref:hypothetical protein n=1 Tax=Actinacidiphila sp. DG2A-62 TaxID=3108821 RepID=UPI002DBC30AF|nr:hypothetical protein [Actinacidiphila sp. DG2A-62]MEC3994015.1 hypothetical protein [Actinacidiphila sp. DG2A-62]
MTGPGGDERRIRQLLRARGVGYAPQEPPPAAGWWDELYDDAHDDHHPGPDGPPPVAPRLPDWRKGATVDLADLGGPDPERPDTAPEPEKQPADEAVEDDDAGETGEWADVDEPDDTERPAPARGRRTPAARRAHAAYLELPARARAALYTGTAAGAGYWAGLAPLMQGWITDCGRHNGTTAGVVLGAGLVLACGVLIDRRTRGWWGPLPWLCRIPLASALLALLLYAPGAS